MRRAAIHIAACLALAACQMGTPLQQSAEEVARAQAKSVINTVVAQKMPGVNAAPVTDCIIDNATLPEIFTIAKGAVTGVSNETIATVLSVSKRPETASCIARNTLGLSLAAVPPEAAALPRSRFM